MVALKGEEGRAKEGEGGERVSWLGRLKAGLARTRAQLSAIFGGRGVDEALFEELEATLITADCGVEATEILIGALRERARRARINRAEELRQALAESLIEVLAPLEAPLEVGGVRPFVLLVVGVNGTGKTTSIGKIARWYQRQGYSVLLAAGDTFRAAAREQLAAWGARNGIPVISQERGDPAAVAFDAVHAAKARGVDLVIIDTAGRLPTQHHLMEELAKVRRVIQKVEPGAPHEVLLVLDATIGQNALAQLEAFDRAVGVSGLVVTKLDGTAKGGVLAAIARRLPKPVRFIGVGEGIDDLRPFVVREFVEALLADGEREG
ncbi:MAG: signal recognition particle-docking protein FtsY [Hydrogenophilus sp.]|nr:signal recognition particle-docking protein FtsY [Hydrogenophilus sp.]